MIIGGKVEYSRPLKATQGVWLIDMHEGDSRMAIDDIMDKPFSSMEALEY